jgi:23S rRNA (guanosine2251-2'-O)-methyltransferase
MKKNYSQNNFKKKKEEENESSLIFGLWPVMETIKEGKEVEKVLMLPSLKGDNIPELKYLIHERKIPLQYVPIEKLNRVTNKNHQGIIAFISPISFYKVEDLLPAIFEKGKNPLILILDRVTDVRNFGAIARTAECSGVDFIIVPSRGSASINADAIKTSAGALSKIPVCRSENLKNTLHYLKESGMQLISCTEKTDTLHYEISFTGPTAILMGSEENGISDEYLKRSDKRAKIPLLGDIGSLNVSVAAGIILYEAIRQRSLSDFGKDLSFA